MRGLIEGPSADIALLTRFPVTVGNVGRSVDEVDYGPFVFEASHESWGSSLGIRIAVSPRDDIQAVTGPAVAHATVAVAAYRPLLDWLRNRVPAIDNAMGTARAYAHIIERFSAAAPPDDLVALLHDALDCVLGLLAQSRENLVPIGPALATFIDQQKSLNRQIAAVLQTNKDGTQKTFDMVRDQYSAVYNDALPKLRQWQDAILRCVAQVSGLYADLTTATSQVESAVQELLGFVINVAAEIEPIVAQIKLAAKGDLSPLLEALHLDIAQAIWADLAARAKA